MPSCRTFLDVDDLVTGSGTTEVDKSECILVFCTRSYFEKRNAMKELYRAVVQRRPILAILEPDASQEGGLNQAAIEALITEELLDQHGLGVKWDEWMEGNKWVSASRLRRASANDVRAALFRLPPVEWRRLPRHAPWRHLAALAVGAGVARRADRRHQLVEERLRLHRECGQLANALRWLRRLWPRVELPERALNELHEVSVPSLRMVEEAGAG